VDSNGPGRIDDSAWSFDGEAIDESLDAMLHTIRAWDWRAAAMGVGLHEVDDGATPTPSAAATVSTETPGYSESTVREPSQFKNVTDTQSLVVEPTPRFVPVAPPTQTLASSTETVERPMDTNVPSALTLERPAAAVPPPPEVVLATESVASPTETVEQPVETAAPVAGTVALEAEAITSRTETVPPPAGSPAGTDAPHLEDEPTIEGSLAGEDVDGTLWFGYKPEPEPEPDDAIRRLWSHRATKLAVLGLVALIAVVLIVGAIRLFAQSPGPTGTTATHHASRPNHHNTHIVVPISAAQLTQFQGYAAALENANLIATRDFERAGGTPTPAQVALEVVAYRTAVNNYNFQLHFIHWPQSMQSAIEADYAQLQSLASVLQAFAFVAQNGVPAWLSQLHNRTGTTQAADNVVRQDLGLPASFSFP